MLKNRNVCFTLQADSCTGANIQGIGRPPEPAPPLRRPTIGDDTQDSVMARLLAAVVLTGIGLAAGLIPTGAAHPAGPAGATCSDNRELTDVQQHGCDVRFVS